MVRMTDLLNKAKKQKETQEPQPPAPEQEKPVVEESSELLDRLSKETPRPQPKTEDIEQRPAPSFPRPQQSSTPAPAHAADDEKVIKLYFDAIEEAQSIFESYRSSGTVNRHNVMNIATVIRNHIISGSREFLRLFHEIDCLESYIYYNAVNVSMLSVMLGIIYSYDKSSLLDLAVLGLLHDIDLIKSKAIINKPDKLSDEELKSIKRHPLNAATLVDSAFKFEKEKVDGILQQVSP